MGYFVEFKYTLTPRFYCAFRLERNEYPLIRDQGYIYWYAQNLTVHDVEIGLGYRFSADTQLKLAYRHDYGDEAYGSPDLYPLGHSLALQLSHHFDVMSWLQTGK
jgi:hypothetical protein